MAKRAYKKKTKPEEKKPEDKSEPMLFERVAVPESPFDKTARRVMAAVDELNKALEEANDCAEMRVFLGSWKDEGKPRRFEATVYRLAHASMTFSLEPKMMWRHVKDAGFQDSAGRGLHAMRQKDDGVFAKAGVER